MYNSSRFRLDKLLCLLILFAASYYSGSAQTKFGQKTITFSGKNVRLADFFNVVWDQTRMQAFYNDEQLSSNEHITVSFYREPLDNVLAFLLRKKRLTWYYREETFVILPIKPGEPLLGLLPEDNRNVIGKVHNKAGEPLPGIPVMVKGTSKGTFTSSQGIFRLFAKAIDMLYIRCNGYLPLTVPVHNDTIDVTLTESVTPLNPIQVVANSTMFSLGVRSSVPKQYLEEQPVSNVLNALQGRVAGLYITQTTGLPGAGFRTRLRGDNSIQNNNNPLVVVDGIPFPVSPINDDYLNGAGSGIGLGANIAASPLNLFAINDIATVDVLKDAGATAQYGSRGVNGVIRIITKRAQTANKGFSVNYYSGLGKATRLVHYLNTDQYLQMRYEALKNDAARPSASDYDLTRWKTDRYTDWQKQMIGGSADIHNLTLEIGNGNDHINYRFSGIYRNETTVYPSHHFNYHKGGAMLKVNYTSTGKKFLAGFSGNYVADRNILPSIDLTTFSTTPPNSPEIYRPDGALNFEESTFDNPYSYFLRTYTASSSSFRAAGTISYEPAKNFLLKANTGITSIVAREVQINPVKSFNPAYSITSGFSNFSKNQLANWVIEPQASYNLSLQQQNILIAVGANVQKDFQLEKGFSATGFNNDAELTNMAAAGMLTPTSNRNDHFLYFSYFANINFDWAAKYLVNINGRREASERLGIKGRFGNFGSVDLGWIFSNEPFLNKSSILTFGKLRLSYGTAGNDQIIPVNNRNYHIPWQLLHYSGISVYATENLHYTWEKNDKLDAGVELRFFNDNMALTISHYRNRASNQLLTYQYTWLGAEKNILVNYPAVVSNTGWEIELIAMPLTSKSLNWTTNVNVTFSKNTLSSFPGIELSSYNNYLSVDMPLDMVKGTHLLGVNAKTGLYEFQDYDGNGTITLKDYQYPIKKGPDWYGGVHNELTWRGWNLAFLFRFVRQQNYIYPYAPTLQPPGSVVNQPVTVLDHWRKSGDKASIQRFTASSGTEAGTAFTHASFSNQQIGDASYIRLQSLSISYELPQKWVEKIRLKRFKLYLQAQNFLTLTGYKGRDPETATSTDIYPPLKIVAGGVQLNW